MLLKLDLYLNQFVFYPGTSDPVEIIEFKRGDSTELVLQTCYGLTPGPIAPEEVLGLKVGIKELGDYSGAFLAFSDTYTFEFTEATGLSTYTIPWNLNTTEVADYLANSDRPDLAYVDAMFEVQITNDGKVTSTKTIIARIWNDVIKDNETTPLGLPTPDAWLDERVPRMDKSLVIDFEQQTQFLANLGMSIDADGVLSITTADGTFTFFGNT